MIWSMRYPGGKGKCYQRLINMMPPHKTYIESHLGGGAALRHKAPAERNIGIDACPNVISLWNQLYPDLCETVQADAADYISEFRFSGNELIYADPPYLTSTRRRPKIYAHEYRTTDHERLIRVLRNAPCLVMISGYENDLYNDALSGWRKERFFAKTHVGLREECVWLNFNPPTQLHDSSHLGANFRERQNIKRRQSRLRERIEGMPPLEREQLLCWLNETYGNRLTEN